MDDDLQDLLQTLPAEFLNMLKNMDRELDSLYDSIIPTLRRRIDDHDEGQCDEIRMFIEDTELQLKMVSRLRSASALMIPLFSETEMQELNNWLEIMARYEEELNKAVEWLNDVLEICFKLE